MEEGGNEQGQVATSVSVTSTLGRAKPRLPPAPSLCLERISCACIYPIRRGQKVHAIDRTRPKIWKNPGVTINIGEAAGPPEVAAIAPSLTRKSLASRETGAGAEVDRRTSYGFASRPRSRASQLSRGGPTRTQCLVARSCCAVWDEGRLPTRLEDGESLMSGNRVISGSACYDPVGRTLSCLVTGPRTRCWVCCKMS